MGAPPVRGCDPLAKAARALSPTGRANTLGPTDLGVVRFRGLMLGAARLLADGEEPAAASNPSAFRVCGCGAVASADLPLDAVMRTRFGDPFGRA